jgi:hypothetical protein
MKIKGTQGMVLDVTFNTSNLDYNDDLFYFGLDDEATGDYVICTAISYESAIALRDELTSLIEQKEEHDNKKQIAMMDKIKQYERLKQELKTYGYLK